MQVKNKSTTNVNYLQSVLIFFFLILLFLFFNKISTIYAYIHIGTYSVLNNLWFGLWDSHHIQRFISIGCRHLKNKCENIHFLHYHRTSRAYTHTYIYNICICIIYYVRLQNDRKTGLIIHGTRLMCRRSDVSVSTRVARCNYYYTLKIIMATSELFKSRLRIVIIEIW